MHVFKKLGFTILIVLVVSSSHHAFSMKKKSKIPAIMDRMIICIDGGIAENRQYKNSGSISFEVWENIRQEAAPMIVSGVILHNIFEQAKELDYKLQKKDNVTVAFQQLLSKYKKLQKETSSQQMVLIDKKIEEKKKAIKRAEKELDTLAEKIDHQIIFAPILDENEQNQLFCRQNVVQSRQVQLNKELLDLRIEKENLPTKCDEKKELHFDLSKKCEKLRYSTLYKQVYDKLFDRWLVFKHTGSDLYKLIPKNYEKKISQQITDLHLSQALVQKIILPNGERWKEITSRDALDKQLVSQWSSKISFYSLCAKALLSRYTGFIKNPEVDLEAIKTAFVKKDSFHGICKVCYNLYFTGHGQFSDITFLNKNELDNQARFAYMTLEQMKDWVEFVKLEINGLSCFFTTCYGGGYHTKKLCEFSKSIDDTHTKEISRTVFIIGALADILVYNDAMTDYNCAFGKNFSYNFAKYFESLEKKDSIQSAVMHMIPKNIAWWSNGLYDITAMPVICQSGTSTICENNSIAVIDSQEDKKLQREKKALVCKSNKIGNLEITYTGGTLPAFIVYPHEAREWTFDKITILHTLREFLDKSIYCMQMPYPVQFKIKTLLCKNLGYLGISNSSDMLTLEDVCITKASKVGWLLRDLQNYEGTVTFKLNGQSYTGRWDDKKRTITFEKK